MYDFVNIGADGNFMDEIIFEYVIVSVWLQMLGFSLQGIILINCAVTF